MHSFQISMETNSIAIPMTITGQQHSDLGFVFISHSPQHLNLKSLINRLLFPTFRTAFEKLGFNSRLFL